MGDLVDELWRGVHPQRTAMPPLRLVGQPVIESAFAVSDLATASIATAGLALAEFLQLLTDVTTEVTVDRTLADAWFRPVLTPIGWELPSPWDDIAGDYETADGWIRLHTNAPHHKVAALAVLARGRREPRTARAVAAAVKHWHGAELERAIVEAGGCAAELRTEDEWLTHPHGSAVTAEELVAFASTTGAAGRYWQPNPVRPLAGIRVLDLTRVIAGPVATRFLAGFGADVLRIDSPDWNEPALVPETTLGKRSARLDIRRDPDVLSELIAGADIVVHGYRADALDRLGFSDRELEAIRPGIVIARLNAYGWTGPWRDRRGFDSLVQFSSGIADTGRLVAGGERPVALPVQALDYATGFLTAAAAIVGLGTQLRAGYGSTASLSLARTARTLVTANQFDPLRSSHEPQHRARVAVDASGHQPTLLDTPWGPASLQPAPLTVGAATQRFDLLPRALGADAPRW